MRIKIQIIITIILIYCGNSLSQFQTFDETPHIGVSSNTGIDYSEKIFFEAHPNAGLAFFAWYFNEPSWIEFPLRG